MEIRDNLLEPGERTTLRLRALYSENGYMPYRMSKFEEYDLYAGNKDFLVSDNVITFTDTDGKLMALKPDVTLSIIKNSRDLPDQTRKVYYVENVYRTAKGVGGFREILQTGLECFGKVTEEDLCQVLRMAAVSVQLLGRSGTLVVSDLTLVSEILSRLVLPRQETQALYTAISQKNIHAIRQLCPVRFHGKNMSGVPPARIRHRLVHRHGPAGKHIQPTNTLRRNRIIAAGLQGHNIAHAVCQKNTLCGFDKPFYPEGVFCKHLDELLQRIGCDTGRNAHRDPPQGQICRKRQLACRSLSGAGQCV